jgi:hypothetical protein
MQPAGAAAPVELPRRGIGEILKSYFYWTYPRGSFHYDVMVTLILLFIAITPQLWNYGDKPWSTRLSHPIQVTGDGGKGLIVTVAASDVIVSANASYPVVKKALREAIMPVTGDAVFVERWETTTDAQGNLVWTVWAHR